jgi:hypothetical protein
MAIVCSAVHENVPSVQELPFYVFVLRHLDKRNFQICILVGLIRLGEDAEGSVTFRVILLR